MSQRCVPELRRGPAATAGRVAQVLRRGPAASAIIGDVNRARHEIVEGEAFGFPVPGKWPGGEQRAESGGRRGNPPPGADSGRLGQVVTRVKERLGSIARRLR